MFLDTCLSILDVAEKVTDVAGKATKLFNWFTGISAGDEMNATVNNLAKEKSKVERLSERILYAPDLHQAVNMDNKKILEDQKRIFELVNPIADALETNILASAVSATPDKLRKVFNNDPWELLLDVRPVNRTKRPTNPDLIPISFHDEGLQYIGWQTRGALPSLFNCDFEYNGSFYVPSKKNYKTPNVEVSDSSEMVIKTHEELAKDSEAMLEELVTLFVHYVYEVDNFYLAPLIPDKKLRNAYGKFPAGQRPEIYALMDFTIWGSSSDFLAFCERGIYYHNAKLADQPGFHFIPYNDLLGRAFSQKMPEDHKTIFMDKGNSLYHIGSQLKAKDIIIILRGVQDIIKKYSYLFHN